MTVPGEVRGTAKLGCWPFHSSCFWRQITKQFLRLYLLLCFKLTFKLLLVLYRWFHQSKEMTRKYLHLHEMKAQFCNWLQIQAEATSHLIQMRQKLLHFKKPPQVSQRISQTPVWAALKLPDMAHSVDKGFFRHCLSSSTLPSGYVPLPELEAAAHHLDLQYLS